MRTNQTSSPKLSLRVADDRLVAANSYVLSFDAERVYRGSRYHWMICSVQNPDELVSWGYAPTRELAETAASSAVKQLQAGLAEEERGGTPNPPSAMTAGDVCYSLHPFA